MKNLFNNHRSSTESPFLPFQPSSRRIKVSLHHLINDLLASLQPLARIRNNVLHNGIPQGLCFVAEENLLALHLWNFLDGVLNTRQNERIHVIALVDDHHTTISIKGAPHPYTVRLPNSHLALP